jgi:hypothetical protein
MEGPWRNRDTAVKFRRQQANFPEFPAFRMESWPRMEGRTPLLRRGRNGCSGDEHFAMGAV